MSATCSNPMVSAVIPTRNRPDLVCRAVRSVLAQSYPHVEAVVVIDGPDAATVQALEAFGDPRIRIVALAENVGGSEARNIGVREARGEFIGLLDDDDEWLPEKTEKQMQVALACPGPNIFVTCKYITRDGVSDTILPPAGPRPDEDISEYLFCSTTVFGMRLGFLQTSTWLISRQFILDVPFTRGLKRNQDTDWIMRALKLHEHTRLFVDEPLAIFYAEPTRKRITTKLDWRDSYGWLNENRNLFTKKSLPYFLVAVCCAHALKQKKLWISLLSIWPDMIRHGRVTPKILAILAKYLILSVIPLGTIKNRVVTALRRFRSGGNSLSSATP